MIRTLLLTLTGYYVKNSIPQMDEFRTIDIEKGNLACSTKDLEKLSTPEGCGLKLVTDRVFSLDEGSHSDDEDIKFDDTSGLTQQAKLERMKREYISLTLNSNRDPIKPGTQSRTKKLLGYYEDKDEDNCEFAKLDDGYSRIHRRYEKLGNYEEIIANQANAFEEISPGRVFKRRLSPGVGSVVSDESLIIYNCAFWTEKSSDPYDSTWLRRNTIITDLSKDSILPGLHELLLTTRKSEWCEALIRPEAAFGQLGALPRIPPNATIFCLLEIVKVVAKDKLSMFYHNTDGARLDETSFNDFHAACDEARMRGNHFHEQKQYRAALQRYKSGIRILEALTYKDENEEKKANLLLMKLYNNCARAANASGDPRFALVACKQASLIDDMQPKTYWNRMIAWKNKGHLDRALGVARRAMQLFPDPKTYKSFQREADELKKRIQNEKVELNDLHRLMSRAILT